MVILDTGIKTVKKADFEDTPKTKQGEVQVIVEGEGYWHEFKKDDDTQDKRFIVQIGWADKDKDVQKGEFKMNWTTFYACVEAWGNDTKKWIGKDLYLDFSKSKLPNGNFVEVIYGKPATKKEKIVTGG